MSIHLSSKAPSAPRAPLSIRAALLGGVAAFGLLGSPAIADTSDSTLRAITFNTWGDQFRNNLDAIQPLFIDGGYDIILFQELRNDAYLSGLQQRLRDAGLGEYTYIRQGDTGVLTRIEGTLGTNTNGDSVAYTQTNADGGTPEMIFGSVHLDYRDPSETRLREVAGITEWAKTTNRTVVLVGDYNAADTSERGLNRASQQKLILQNYLYSGNSFYGTLLEQYAVDAEAMEDFIADHQGQYLSLDDIPDDLFADETYPIEDNTPVTMNALKHNFILLQTEDIREGFEPHVLGDGITTWTSVEEDATNTWPSWDRSSIDHFLVSRPFGKWFKIVDVEGDEYTGVLDQTDVTADGTAYSDHELVAHDLAWVGPVLEYYDNGEGTEETRVVWGEEANTFDDDEGVFYLTRNNMRTDVFLGQISDEQGTPILDWLTEEEKKTLLDCTSTDSRLSDAIAEYCIDDHGFISELLVSDGGTVQVDEDAAMGNSDAVLRLDNGGLEILGEEMTALDRTVSLESAGGWIDVDSADANVAALQAIQGTGALEKRGAGVLTLDAENTYTGATLVSAGTLVVNGSIASSSGTTVAEGARLGGTGTLGSLTLASGATLSPGNSIGTLAIDGDLSFGEGSFFEVEVNAAGESDLVTVSGDVTIAGGTALALAADGDYEAYTAYTIIEAGGAISGAFDSVNSSLAFLDADLSYGDDAVTLMLERNDTAFDEVADTGNEAATADGVESLGYGNPLYNAVVLLDQDTAAAAFDALSGELYAATMTALAQQGDTLRQSALGQMRDMADTGTAQFWMQTYGGDQTAKADDLHDLSHSTFGTLVGVNGRLDGGWTYGAMAGYGTSHATLDGLDGRADTSDTSFGIVGGRDFGLASLSAGLTWTHSEVDSRRGVSFADFSDTLNAEYGADTTQIFAELAYDLNVNGAVLQPYGNIARIMVKTDGTTENGGDAALTVASNSYDATVGELGLRAQTQIGNGPVPVTLGGELGWRHVFSDSTPSASMAFAGGSSYGVDGVGLAQDMVTVDLTVGLALTDQTGLNLGYSGAFGDGGQSNNLSAMLKVNF